ncbi:hypothetical protein BJX96DRAFT_147394 [Aspergillus floccosus]
MEYLIATAGRVCCQRYGESESKVMLFDFFLAFLPFFLGFLSLWFQKGRVYSVIGLQGRS